LTTLLITFVIIFIVVLLTYYLHTKNKIIIPYKKEIIIEPVKMKLSDKTKFLDPATNSCSMLGELNESDVQKELNN